MFSAKSGWGLGPALPGGAVSVTCEGLVYSPRIKYLLELANYQHLFTGCPVLLCPWPLCSSLASTSCVEGLRHSQQTHAPCPLRDIPCWDGVLCGNLLSTNDPFMTETLRGHSQGCYSLWWFVCRFSHQDPGAGPVQNCHCHEKGTDDCGIK